MLLTPADFIPLTVGAAFETSPSDWCPLQVGLDPGLQAHVLLLHGIKSITHGVHHLHHVDLAVWQKLRHRRRRRSRERKQSWRQDVKVKSYLFVFFNPLILHTFCWQSNLLHFKLEKNPIICCRIWRTDIRQVMKRIVTEVQSRRAATDTRKDENNFVKTSKTLLILRRNLIFSQWIFFTLPKWLLLCHKIN